MHISAGNYPKQSATIPQQSVEFYPYLYGHKFQLVTDNNLLTSIRNLKDVGGRLSRWIMFLQQFDFEFVFKAGSTLTQADALSRIPENTAEVLNLVLDGFEGLDLEKKTNGGSTDPGHCCSNAGCR